MLLPRFRTTSARNGTGRFQALTINFFARVHKTIELGLWLMIAFMAAGALHVILHIKEIHANAANAEAAAIQAENRSFCERYGLKAPNVVFFRCTHDLDVVRANQARRLSEDLMF